MNYELIKKWYSDKRVMFEIVKCIKDKEVSILGDKRVRCIIANQYKYFNSNLDKFMFFESVNNLYYSLANFDWKKLNSVLSFRCFSFAHDERKKQMKEFNLKATSLIKSYDLGIDFDNHDGDNFKKVYKDCNLLKYYFDKYKVEYSLKLSGSGLHIEVKADKLPKYIKVEADITKRVKMIGEMMTDIKLMLDLDTMDVGEIDNVEVGSFYETRRIFKIPYTLDYKTGIVAFPLNDDQFGYLRLSRIEDLKRCFSVDMVLKMNLFNRGILTREGSSKGFDKFLEEVIY